VVTSSLKVTGMAVGVVQAVEVGVDEDVVVDDPEG
jgi:hypothetical protein